MTITNEVIYLKETKSSKYSSGEMYMLKTIESYSVKSIEDIQLRIIGMGFYPASYLVKKKYTYVIKYGKFVSSSKRLISPYRDTILPEYEKEFIENIDLPYENKYYYMYKVYEGIIINKVKAAYKQIIKWLN